MNINHIIDLGYELGMVQSRYEIEEAAYFLMAQQIKDFVEIGTDRGGTFLVWSKISDPSGLKISIDWARGPWSHPDCDVEKRNQKLKSLGENVHLIEGDSHKEHIRYKLEDVLKGKKVDFLFIDGDHSYMGVKLDYYMYKDFVKPGGWIGFHDIKPTEFHHENGCFVDEFWDEIPQQKFWFMSQESYGGIGLIKV